MIDTVGHRTQKYFIGSNTSSAFVFCGEGAFEGIKRIYVIKGGPGTGKSTFLKRVAAAFENKGSSVEYYYCSSDPDSLDAITVKDAGIAITDGTSPHVYEAKFPGAKEEYLNFGRFWDSESLGQKFDEIEELTVKKAKAFTSAYKYLSIAEKVWEEREGILLSCYDSQKAEAAVSRFMKTVGTGVGCCLKKRQISALSMNGRVRFDTYENLSEKIIAVTDKRGAAPLILDEIVRQAAIMKLDTRVSYDPIMRLEGVFFPEKKITVIVSPQGTVDKEINTERFIKNDLLSANRKRLRFLRALEEDLIGSAAEELAGAKDHHFTLEKIYSEAMDFEALENMCGEFIGNKLKI